MPAETIITPVKTGGQTQYVVLNPMHIINLQDRTRTLTVRIVEKLKAISEKWFTHILLLIFLMIYASLGALLFQWIEAPLEIGEKQSINRTRELIMQKLWDARNMSNSQWVYHVHKRLKEYEEQLEQHLKSKAPPDSEKIVWTFWGSLFYAGTIFTTIGYGNIVPATRAGQAVTIVYAFLGIPFLLMVLADLGKLFTRWIKAVFYYCRIFYHTGKFRKARKLGRRATAVPVQYISVAWNKMPMMVYQGKKSNTDSDTPTDTDTETKPKKENSTPDGDQEQAKEPAILQDDDDDEFNLPVSLAIVLLLTYMMLGAFLFTLWEEWTFFESFYFVFISMSTIGFGDYVPDHPMFMMGTFIYLLFGLALTSMCINVIQEKLSATFEMAKLRIGTTIGLDANILMDDDNASEKGDTPDGRRKSKSRRGSKAAPSAKRDEEIEQDQLALKENGVKSDGPS